MFFRAPGRQTGASAQAGAGAFQLVGTDIDRIGPVGGRGLTKAAAALPAACGERRRRAAVAGLDLVLDARLVQFGADLVAAGLGLANGQFPALKQRDHPAPLLC